MKKIFRIIFTLIIIYLINHSFAFSQNEKIKIGLLAPLSGEYKELGNSLLYSLQLALDEIDDKSVFIIPRDSGFNNKEKIEDAIKDIRSQGALSLIHI